MEKYEKIKINSEIIRVLKEFCFRNNKNIEEFVEDAILEKIEKEELKDNISEIINNDEYKEEIFNEYIINELEFYKKKH